MTGRNSIVGDERAVSTTITYTLTIAVTTILVSGLIVAAGGLVEDQRERAVHDELGVVGERIASELAGVDRLAESGDELQLETTHPRQLAGATYTVTLQASAPNVCSQSPCLVLNSSRPDVTITVPLVNETAVRTSSAPGGSVVVTYEPANETLALEAK